MAVQASLSQNPVSAVQGSLYLNFEIRTDLVHGSLHLNIKIRTVLAVHGYLHLNFKIRTNLAVYESLHPFIKIGPKWRSKHPYRKIRTNLAVQGSLHPLSKIQTHLAVQGSLFQNSDQLGVRGAMVYPCCIIPITHTQNGKKDINCEKYFSPDSSPSKKSGPGRD